MDGPLPQLGYNKQEISQAVKRQKAIHRETMREPSRAIGGDLELRRGVRVDPVLFHNQRIKHGNRVWEDKSFIKEMKRDSKRADCPIEANVRSSKISVMMPGGTPPAKGRPTNFFGRVSIRQIFQNGKIYEIAYDEKGNETVRQVKGFI